jgi:hypothetical protein
MTNKSTIATLSSRLTAFFNVDGGHLSRYIRRKATIANSLCEDVLLHDRVVIPTPDYLTACGLIQIVGERGVIELLEQGRLTFVRTKGLPCFVQGKKMEVWRSYKTPLPNGRKIAHSRNRLPRA